MLLGDNFTVLLIPFLTVITTTDNDDDDDENYVCDNDDKKRIVTKVTKIMTTIATKRIR